MGSLDLGGFSVSWLGVVAKWLMPGPDGGGFVLTTLLGIAGAVVGGFVGTLLGVGSPSGFNLGRHRALGRRRAAPLVGTSPAARRIDVAR